MESIWLIIIITLSFCAARKALFNLLHQKYPPGSVSIPILTTISKIITSNQYNISGGSYGPLWRLLRRNLTLQILHPSKIKSFSPARKLVLNIIKESINRESESGETLFLFFIIFNLVCFVYLFLCVLVKNLMRKFLEKLNISREVYYWGLVDFRFLIFFPRLNKIVFKKKWEEFYKLRSDQEKVLIPLIRSRQEQQMKKKKTSSLCYVDSLLNLELPDDEEGGKTKLTENEMVSLCSEFLNGEIMMMVVVRYKEEDLKKLTHLRAVILGGLRRHRPGHFEA
ncbi:hypothetical protein MKX01_020696 [Papaver californicum]|nr:hypothetical protein MKX01_020696 [Papaver californicum]